MHAWHVAAGRVCAHAVEASDLTSYATQVSLDYFSLPICAPAGGAPDDRSATQLVASGLGSTWPGRQTGQSPYTFRTGVHFTVHGHDYWHLLTKLAALAWVLPQYSQPPGTTSAIRYD